MGQYYRTVFLAPNEDKIVGFCHPFDTGNGMKLTESCYIRNSHMNNVLANLRNYFRTTKNFPRLVFAGDYAKKEKGKRKNLYDMCNMKSNEGFHLPVRKIGDYDVQFIFNIDKHEYVNLYDVETYNGYQFHPLPMLCAEGNGQGGGDYEGTSMNLVGSWARDRLLVVTKKEFSALDKHKNIKKALGFSDWYTSSWYREDDLKRYGWKNINPNFVEPHALRYTLISAIKGYQQLVAEGEMDENARKWLISSFKEHELPTSLRALLNPKPKMVDIEVQAVATATP